jgi:putative CocE/NonD family hydrolase
VCCTGTPDAPEGSFDQSEVEAREDVLVYSTPPLTDGVELTGPIEAVLHVSSSARDTDFTAKLVDVYPDGTAYNVQEGILRARYRQGFDRKVWMKPGEVVEVRIDLQATSNYFPPGHRIRLEISSSNFPRFDRNLNTGGNNFDEIDWVVAENAVHHDRRFPSHLLLPVIP